MQLPQGINLKIFRYFYCQKIQLVFQVKKTPFERRFKLCSYEKKIPHFACTGIFTPDGF